MKWNRRNFLKTAAVLSASPVAGRWPALAQSSQDPGDTVFMQGALGGGGYACGINISPDGLTRTIRNDTHGLTVWDEKSQTWQQVMKSPNMDACSIRWGVGGNIYEVAVAPSNSARSLFDRHKFQERHGHRLAQCCHELDDNLSER